MGKAVPANGSQSMRVKVTHSQSLPDYGWTPRHTIITLANGPRAGKRFIGRHVDLTQGIQLGFSRRIENIVSIPVCPTGSKDGCIRP